MAMKRCDNGHFYDTNKNSSCPSCGVVGLDVEATLAHTGSLERYDLDTPTVAKTSPKEANQRGKSPSSQPGSDQGATVAVYKKNLGIDPVVGWLVCINGPDKGRDFRIRNERNFIGRSPSMDICISGDGGISRERHAVISFNPRKKSFLLTPGESHGIVYHNDDEVVGPVELKPYDRIELAQTHLLFVPFCGDQFNWI